MTNFFSGPGFVPAGITLVRALTGWLIFRHSLELFDINGLIDFLRQAKVPLPAFSAYTAKLIELVGGIFLILGLFTKWITPLLMLIMLGVIATMHHWNFYEGEHPLLFLLLFAAFFFYGPGPWSLDKRIQTRRTPAS
ncbi:DoxX family protein [Flavihumibacter sp. CACIAM 22H1]|uniref:DoxX family protein n=1 Tax=Flavihumibacter sp. CACIAM 22H1 TaxID=1812911 RepID=UPI0007A893B6|nr:DoxX family protein [Flavihumibacter sp. CACIAM 22H1]KYP15346.1 MAG: hypothetical protein A1D16_15715 [Flavihumibacter sp. CACIAM 22H1]